MTYPSFPFESQVPPRQAQAADDFIDLERLLQVALRQARVVIICAAIGLVAGILYLQTTPPTYTSTARVLIDDELGRVADDGSPLAASLISDAEILSQVEVLRSSRLAAAVADRLTLDQDEDFLDPPVSLLSATIGYIRGLKDLLLGSPSPKVSTPAEAQTATPEEGSRRQAIQTLQGTVGAERVGRSFVIAISYRSHDPRMAAAIAGAYAEAYLADQLNASFDATEQATVWLQGRLAELRENSQAAALAVEKYRAENGLAVARGGLVTEQRLTELTAQLTEAQADTARARARYEQYRSIAEAGSPDAVERALQNSVISSEQQAPNSNIGPLRTRYLNIAQRLRQIRTDFGADHPQAVALERERGELAGQIVGELRQLAQSYRNEYEVAQARENSIRQSVADATGESSEANQSQVRLRELEQQAAAVSSLYQTYLNRYERTTQQQSFPVAKARIISEAAAPRSPSSPRTSMVLGLCLVIGAMIGGAFGALNEFNERFFRTADDVSGRLGLKFLGYLPLVGMTPDKVAKTRSRIFGGSAAKETSSPIGRRERMRVTVEAPSSMFAETLRNAKIAADLMLQNSQGKVIGVISTLPGEGKSTVAANLAQLLASNNFKTLLIDGDLRNPALTRGLGIDAEAGLVEAVMDTPSWRSMLKFDRKTRLAIMPGLVRGHFSHTSETLSSPGMRRLIQEAKGVFQYIIVDLPPLGPVVDAKAFAPLAEGFVVVAEWGRTPRALVRSLLASEPAIAGKVIGLLLNKVRLEALPKYGALGGSEQFVARYAAYYIDRPERPKDGERPPVTKKSAVPAGQ